MVATARITHRVRRVYYGWLIVIAGMGGQAVQAALLSSSFGTYVVLMTEDFGWSKTVFSLAFSLQQLESGILGPVQGRLLDRFGPRATMRVGAPAARATFAPPSGASRRKRLSGNSAALLRLRSMVGDSL